MGRWGYPVARWLDSAKPDFSSQVCDLASSSVCTIRVVLVDVSLRELCCRGEVFDYGAVCGGGGSQTAWGGRRGGEFGEAAAQYVVLDPGEELRGLQAVVACSYIGGAKGTRTP